MSSGRSRLLAAVTALAVLGVTPPVHASSSPQPAPPSGYGTSVPRTITLITGDKVTVRMNGAKLNSVVVQGPAGGPARARITTVGKDTYVYPDSAMPYIAANMLDTQLFDITTLIAANYDDAHAKQLPLIVTYAEGAAGARARQKATAGATTVRPFTSINGAALTQDRGKAKDFWSSLTGRPPGAAPKALATNTPPSFANGVAKVWLDGKVKADMADTTAQIGAPDVWAGGNTGAGVDVAVLDTGIDTEHPDVAGQIAAAASFVPGEEEISDYVGHGTHVASTIAGTGAASNGTEKGVAPGARLDVGKVFGRDGSGQVSWVIAAMEWAARDRHAKIVSMSLGTEAPTDGTDPMSQAVNALSAETGALFTVSAGNSGPYASTIGAPGAADAALTVGAVDVSDQLADFSSRGPRLADGALKPEITAPGVNVLAARSHYAATGEGYYISYSGTSMAAPHVAGAAALVAAAHPDWTGQRIKDALVNTAKATPAYSQDLAGAGRVDAKAAVGATVVGTASAYLGIYPLNHPPAEQPTKTVTYTNVSDSDVTLDLALHVSDIPNGLLSLSADRVVVPAHGTGTVTITASLDGITTKANWSGLLEASSGDAVVAHTVVGISTTDRPRHLVVKATDRDGTPISGLVSFYRNGDGPNSFHVYPVGSQPLDVLLPEGGYSVWMWGDVQGSHGPGSRGIALMRQDDIDLQADTTVNLDASTTQQITAVTPQETIDTNYRLDYYRSFSDTSYVSDSFTVDPAYDSIWAQPAEQPKTGDLSLNVRWHKTEPLLTLSSGSRGEPYQGLWVDPQAAKLPKGTQDLTAVFAGDGTDYSGVNASGKIAVVRRNGDMAGQVSSAQAAGAKLLLVVNDQPGRLTDTGATSLPVATLTKDEGEDLIAQLGKGPVRLSTVSHPVQDYAYDLVQRWDNRIPKTLSYRPQLSDLAKIDVSWNYDLGTPVDGYRFDTIPHTGYITGYYLSVPEQHARTEYATTTAGGEAVSWQAVYEMLGASELQYGPVTTYRPQTATGEKWFGPIRRPRGNSSSNLLARIGDTLVAQIYAWGEAGNANTGFWTRGALSQATNLYQGDTLISQNNGDLVVAELSPEALPYTLVATAEIDGTVDPYSTHTETRWGFTSRTTDGQQTLPLIQLDYDVDTDLSGKAARTTKLTVMPTQLDGVSAKIHSAGLKVSYDDGATWQTAHLSHKGTGWTATLHAPRDAQYATLRTTAKPFGPAPRNSSGGRARVS